ncbi:hypothetical protein AB0K18_48320 [Nonomuraea sp. NPDC049421]|uniref:hypothetical protein n=1 Tax=Nonomuraea sp. NPDC049421 TaxID=3155275 RepID=UPI00342C5536
MGGHAFLGGDQAAVAEFTRQLVEVYEVAPEEAADIPVTGGGEQVAERLHAFAEAGAGAVTLNLDGGHWVRQAETLAEARHRLQAGSDAWWARR